jgi:hypothetical protein
MPLDTQRLPVAASGRLAPVEPRLVPLFCLILLTAACALASFVFACATPFAAFAVVAAATLPLGPALVMVTVAWLVNQAIGFGVLHYPLDLNTLLWGFAIGAAALIETGASKLALRSVPRTASPVALGLALIAAYAAYEVVLFACVGWGRLIYVGHRCSARPPECGLADRIGGGLRSVPPAERRPSSASGHTISCRPLGDPSPEGPRSGRALGFDFDLAL